MREGRAVLRPRRAPAGDARGRVLARATAARRVSYASSRGATCRSGSWPPWRAHSRYVVCPACDSGVARRALVRVARSGASGALRRSTCARAVAVDDLADDPGVVPGGADDVDARATPSSAGHDREHAEAEVEDVLHLVVGDGAGALDLGEDPRLVPRAASHDAVAVVGQHAHEVAGDAAAGDVRERVHRDVVGAARPSPARRSRSAAAARRRASGARRPTPGSSSDAPGPVEQRARARASSRCSAGPGSRSR